MSDSRLSILFITRKYPPSVGGMQRASYELANHLARTCDVRLIAWGHSQVFLPLFVSWALILTVVLWIRGRKADVVLLGDGVLAPLGVLLKGFTRRPVAVIVHGLDVTFSNPFYQLVIPRCLRRLDRVVCVSQHTRDLCLQQGVPAARCQVISNGVSVAPKGPPRDQVCQALVSVAGLDLADRPVLLTVGRLVRRKGVAWFVDEVLPRLVERHPRLVYVIVGKGPLQSEIERLARYHQLGEHVLLAGQVSEPVLQLLYEAGDLFVMPNIPVPGDVEGFGIVALEAGAAGCWTVASGTEGIRDAIADGENGSLVVSGDVDGFVATINGLLAEDKLSERGERASDFVACHYGWDTVAARYREVLLQLAQSSEEASRFGAGNV